MSGSTWNCRFDLPDGSYPVSYIKTILSTLLKNVKIETIANNSLGQSYLNKIKNRIVFKIKARYKLEWLSPETMRLLGSTKCWCWSRWGDRSWEHVLKLESVEVGLVHRNLVNNNYQQVSKVLFTFMPNKQFGQLITIAPHSLNATNSVCFTDQNSKQLEIAQKTAEKTRNLIGNEIADKITSIGKIKSKEKKR